MKSKKSLKALIVSVLSLVVCMSLFVGSTFAWFTDSAVGKNQVIKTGNLDMIVTASTSGEESDYEAVETKELFDETALWEPGHVEYAYVRVENNGSLSFEYSMKMNVISEEKGVNQQGQDFYLSDYIRYGIVAGKTTFSAGDAGRAEAIALVEASSTLLEDTYFADEVVLYGNQVAANEFHDYTVVVYMPTSVGNEANHNGTVPSVTFGMEFNATQFNYEADEFGPDYDKDAPYPYAVTTTEALEDAIAQGYSVVNVAGDVTLSEQINVENGSLTLIGSGDGATVTAPAGGSRIVNVAGQTEDVVVNLQNLTLAAENAERGISFLNNSGKVEVNVENCYIEAKMYGIKPSGGNDDVTILVTNSTVKGWSAVECYSAADITFVNCDLIGVNTKTVSNDFAVFSFATDYSVTPDPRTSAGSSLTLENCNVYAVKANAGEQAHIIVDKAYADTYNFTFTNTTFYTGTQADLSDAAAVAEPVIIYADFANGGIGYDADGNVVPGWDD